MNNKLKNKCLTIESLCDFFCRYDMDEWSPPIMELKKVGNYIKELEEQNKEMLECLIEYLKYYNDIDYDEVGNFKENFKKEISIVEKITGRPIEEVLKNE